MYIFSMQRQRGATTDWWCAVRNKKVRCPASVQHRGGVYLQGRLAHTHLPETNPLMTAQITADVSQNKNKNK